MNLGSNKELLNRIIESLQLVAAQADQQIAAIPRQACMPDEIALTLEESCAFVPRLKEAKLISAELDDMLAQINERFAELSGAKHSEFWTEESLRRNPEWDRMREMANDVLKSLGTEKRPPILYWMKCV